MIIKLFPVLLLFATTATAQTTSLTGDQRWTAWSAQPATKWEDAFVTGNGHHGMMMTGKPGEERIICVHEELFLRAWDRNKIAVANTAGLLPAVRQLVDAGKLDSADALAVGEARKQLSAMGAPQAWPVSPHPAFNLDIHTNSQGTISHYKRSLDMERGEARSAWKDAGGGVEYGMFSSRTANVNVMRIRGIDGRKLSTTLALRETPGRHGNVDGVDVSKAFRDINTHADPGGWLSYHAAYSRDSGGYEGLARVTIKGGQMRTAGDSIQITDANEILVVLRITPLQYGITTQRVAVQNELTALSLNYDELLRPHAQQHAAMFRRVQLDLGCAAQWAAIPVEKMLAEAHQHGATPLFLEQMHAMGRYLLISTSGKYPPPLQGIWGGGWTPAWNGGFVFDSNVNLAISAISTGDLSECAESYFGYVERLLPAWRLNAMSYLGCRGFLVPHYSDPEKGFLNHFGNGYPWMYWPSGAGWNLMPFYEHGMLTGDTTFLRKRVLPLYLEMAQFYEDYLTKEKDGYYHISPGISPENNVGSNATTLAKDCTIDIAVAREVFDHLLKLGKLFGMEKAQTDKWRNYYDQMVPYRINADSALAEWAPQDYPDNYAHRHNSHMYPVFPGTAFLQPDSDPKLLQAARVALSKRFGYDTESAHGLIHIALMAARLHDAEKVAMNLQRFAQRHYVYNGLVTSHNPEHSIYNLDAALSLQRLLSDLLVFSQPGRVELLPACSSSFPTGKLTGLRIHGGHKLDISWANGGLVSAVVHAGHNDSCTFICNKKSVTIKMVAGKQYRFNNRMELR